MFFREFPISAEVPHQLSWTHFVELLNIDDPLAFKSVNQLVSQS